MKNSMKILNIIFSITMMVSACANKEQNNNNNSEQHGTLESEQVTELEATPEKKILISEEKFEHYGTVVIGNQVWNTHNLRVSTFRNGDTIFHAKTNWEWRKAGQERRPAWIYYSVGGEEWTSERGKYYNWFAVNDPRGLAPIGGHIPSSEEWKILITYLGGQELAVPLLKYQEGWSGSYGYRNPALNGNNLSGFNAKADGYCDEVGVFKNQFGSGNWWSSSGYNDIVWGLWITNTANGNRHNPACGFSVRCLMDIVKPDTVLEDTLKREEFEDTIINDTIKYGGYLVFKEKKYGLIVATKDLEHGWRGCIDDCNCDDFVSNGFSDWRLPSTVELNAIHEKLLNEKHGNISNGWFWSSLKEEEAQRKTLKGFLKGVYTAFDGGVMFYMIDSTGRIINGAPMSVRCVREL